MAARTKRVLAYGTAAAALAGVFVLYTRPGMMVAVGDMIWACFQ